MQRLVQAFNPAAVTGLMCRNTLSVGFDGRLYDCDFNQMLDLEIALPQGPHISTFDEQELARARSSPPPLLRLHRRRRQLVRRADCVSYPPPPGDCARCARGSRSARPST